MFESAVTPHPADALEVGELDAASCVAAVESNQRLGIEQSCRTLILAARWADLHPAEAIRQSRTPGAERPSEPGGSGTPAVAGFAAAELAALMGTSAGAASKLLGDALDLRHRLPLTWARVVAADVPGHHARRVAQATRHLTPDAAGRVDVAIAGTLTALSFGRLDECLQAAVYWADPAAAEAEADLALRERFVRLGRTSRHGLRLVVARAAAGDAVYLDAMVGRLAQILAEQGSLDGLDVRRSRAFGILARPAEAMRLLADHATAPDAESEDESDPDPDGDHRSVEIAPSPIDPRRVRPRVTVYVHVSAEAVQAGRGVARVEGIGPVVLPQLRRVLGDGVAVRVQPVIDLADEPAAVDCYEVPDRMREHVVLRQPADRFPYAASLARRPGRSADLDHAVTYLAPEKGGPPGQTRIGNLAPLSRFHHRVRTHGLWNLRQPEPETSVWRSPHGRIYLVNASGTHPLGGGDFATTVWRSAEPYDDVRRAG